MWSLISIEFYIIAAIVFGLLGRYIAKQKNRSGAEGFWLGFLFSALGVIIIALLPTKVINQTINSFNNQYNNDDNMPKSVYSLENKLFFYLIMLVALIITLVANN